MTVCPACQFHNREGRTSCLKCGATLGHRDDVAPDLEQIERAVRRPDRLSAANRSFAHLRGRLRETFSFPVPANLPWRFPFLAAHLSLIPGLGQLYNHQPRKAALLAGCFIAACLLVIPVITVPYAGNTMLALALFVICASYADALLTAARINGQTFSGRQTVTAYVYPVLYFALVGVVCAVMAWGHWPFFTMFRVSQNYMAPAFVKGDRIAGQGLTYIAFEPRPGEVVRYDPPGYRIDVGESIYLVNPQNGWERVMAVGGETLEYRDGCFFIDGRELAPDWRPLVTSHLPEGGFRIDCPPDHYVVLITWRAVDRGIVAQLQGGALQAPALGGESWLKACIITKKDIFSRSHFIYQPAPRRRFLTSREPRFLDEIEEPHTARQ